MLCLEVSCLARINADWSHPLGWSNMSVTLVSDADGTYD